MSHKHNCLECGKVISEGNFDCEFDTDHDFALCPACAAEQAAAERAAAEAEEAQLQEELRQQEEADHRLRGGRCVCQN